MAESAETPSRDAARRARLAFLTVRALTEMDPSVLVVPDAESGEVPLGPDFLPADLVVQHLDLRLRLVLLINTKDKEMLSKPSTLHAAEILLKHWPETAAVGLVANDSDLSCLVVEPFDVEPSIGTPSGRSLPPTPRGEPLPVSDAVKAYLEVVVPDWERVPPSAELAAEGYEDLTPSIASGVRAEIADRRANIDEKRAALDSIDETEARWAARVVLEAGSKGLDGSELAKEIEKRARRNR